ncbi:MAG TPA: hypothetical protein VFJ19_18925 [Nocardioidaceae bacterium]|nr:hypothetical protein [Nocardioidaceae bacterium]
MTPTTLSPLHGDRATEVPGPPAQGVWIDLCGLDYYERRRRLYGALCALAPGVATQIISSRAEDVAWLRYELESRLPQRYSWSLPREIHGVTVTTVRLSEQETR